MSSFGKMYIFDVTSEGVSHRVLWELTGVYGLRDCPFSICIQPARLPWFPSVCREQPRVDLPSLSLQMVTVEGPAASHKWSESADELCRRLTCRYSSTSSSSCRR